jgi:hypothetical protein
MERDVPVTKLLIHFLNWPFKQPEDDFFDQDAGSAAMAGVINYRQLSRFRF